MRLVWSSRGIPHGFLCAQPIHLIYRVKHCAPVKQLRELHEDLKFRVKALRGLVNETSNEYAEALEEWQLAYDDLLDAQDQSKYVLAQDLAARVVIDSWLELQRRGEIVLYAICVMGNHVHVLLRGPDESEEVPIGDVVRRHKSFTGKSIRKQLSLADTLWDDGFYDRYVRPGRFWVTLQYILDNPVKAGVVSHWSEYSGTYVDKRCLDGLMKS